MRYVVVFADSIVVLHGRAWRIIQPARRRLGYGSSPRSSSSSSNQCGRGRLCYVIQRRLGNEVNRRTANSLEISYTSAVFLSLSVRTPISRMTRPDFAPNSSRVTCSGRGSILLWECCDTLCASSGVVDDVIFAQNDQE